jgi:hypothetical protein
MSERALGFVEEWISQHVHAEGYEPEGDNSHAKITRRTMSHERKRKREFPKPRLGNRSTI